MRLRKTNQLRSSLVTLRTRRRLGGTEAGLNPAVLIPAQVNLLTGSPRRNGGSEHTRNIYAICMSISGAGQPGKCSTTIQMPIQESCALYPLQDSWLVQGFRGCANIYARSATIFG